jgi:uncharacterized protein YcbK (DUF882 family)
MMNKLRYQHDVKHEKIIEGSYSFVLPESQGRSILSHRKFASQLFGVLLLFFSVCAATFAGGSPVQPEQAYRLRLYHLHTNESIDVVYRIGDTYVPSAIDQLDHFLRDHRTGDVIELDRRVFDLLHDLTAAAGRPDSVIDIVCGYRTPWSNEFLRRTTQGVASHSLHMEGEAIDIRMPGVSTSRLRDVALSLHRGGVGYYPESQFVHVDVGRIRRW